MEGEVIEGFLCPICYSDLKTVVNLNFHFQEQHLEDQNLFKSVKDMYDKARKKMKWTNQAGVVGDPEPTPGTSNRRITGYQASQPLEPEAVIWRSHMTRFKAIRDLRNERYAAQTNTLLIRLGKLLQQLPSDPVKRKAYEQDVVAWVDAKDVSLCPGCAKPFSLIKRKHHCRLCGAVMCKSCTFYLPLEQARRLIGNSLGAVSQSTLGKEVVSASPRSTKLQTVQAVQSVLNLDSSIDGDFLLCEHCYRLLEARETVRLNRSEKPIIAQFYERLRAALDDCNKAVTSYLNINNSLRQGEESYSLSEAKELKVEILRLAETIDATSKKIAVLGQNTENPPEGARLRLQQTVRNAAALYIKENVITLPSLPTEEEIAEFQEIRRRNYERKIEEERRKEMEELARLKELGIGDCQNDYSISTPNTSNRRPNSDTPSKVIIQDSWTPSVKQAIITDDPLLQQIGILHGFIQQARLAGKLDECEALERNLRELQEHLDMRESQHF